MLESATALTAIELYKKLVAAFKVTAVYKVSFSQEVSPDVLEIIKYLKGDLQAQDLIPFPTSLSLDVELPGGINKLFHQDSNTYMTAFDEHSFRNFAEACLEMLPNTEFLT